MPQTKKEKLTKALIKDIVKEMQHIIGDVAIVQANLVPGLTINHEIIITIDPSIVTEKLIERYQRLMGPVAITIAKKGAQKATKKWKGLTIPEILK